MARLTSLPTRVKAVDTRKVHVAPKTAAPIYSTPEYQAWRTLVVGRANGRCQDPLCKYPHRKPSRLFADHIIELRDGGAPFDPANGMARCGSCHTRKTAAERAKRLSA